MEITKIKRNGCEVSVLFTGMQYIFHSSFYGILAVAERKGYKKEDGNYFTIRYGNCHTIGGSFGGEACLVMAKQFVKKTENRYIKQDIVFEAVKEDLNGWRIDCEAVRR